MEDLKQSLRTTSQIISDRLPAFIKTQQSNLNIPFPRGVIRKIDSVSPDLYPYLTKEQLHTLACALQLCDIHTWNLRVWDIRLTAGSMYEFCAATQIINIAEFLLRQFCSVHFNRHKLTFKESTDLLFRRDVVSELLRDELHAWRAFRNQQHLNEMTNITKKPKTEIRTRTYNNTIRTLRLLRGRLKIAHAEREALSPLKIGTQV